MSALNLLKDGIFEITTYAQIAISFREYRKARYCVYHNMNNNGVTPEEREKLYVISKGIDRAISRERAVEMLKNPNVDSQRIIKETGISEIDLIRLQRKIFNGEDPLKVREKIFGEDD